MPKYVTVGAYNNPLEAHLARGRLEAEGIPAFLTDEHHVWANWVYSQALGGVKIQVAEEHADSAEQILAAHNRGEFEKSLDEDIPDSDGNICPRCGSGEFRSRFPVRMIMLVLLTLGLFSVIFPPRRELHTCVKCGCKWRY